MTRRKPTPDKLLRQTVRDYADSQDGMERHAAGLARELLATRNALRAFVQDDGLSHDDGKCPCPLCRPARRVLPEFQKEKP